MAVKLRLRREGTTKKAHYRVVAADSRSPRNGRFIEIIGEYHPREDPSGIAIDSERALHWLRHGAQPTGAVENLLRITGVWDEFKPGDASGRERAGDGQQRPSKKARAKAAAARATEPATADAAPAGDAAGGDAEGGDA